MRTSNFKRAAGHAALFASLGVFAMSGLAVFIAPAMAKMRTDRLVIEPANGGAGNTIDIEVATTDQEKALGLMFRTKLDDREGMLFYYGKPRDITMWMRNTYISLDMVFIRDDGTIFRIEDNTEPLSERVIAAGAPVAAVLEMAGGAAKRLGIKPGDRIKYATFQAKPAP